MSQQPDTTIGTEDLERGLVPMPLRQVPIIAGIALAALLAFNSQGLVSWAQRLPSTPKNEWISARAADWHEVMLRLGLAQPMIELQGWLKKHEGSRR